MSETRIWVLSIEHRHGIDHSAHRTEEGARVALLSYVDEWWHELAERDFGPPPTDPQERIARYFEDSNDEFYTLADTELQGDERK